jgi:hypothetical protein
MKNNPTKSKAETSILNAIKKKNPGIKETAKPQPQGPSILVQIRLMTYR